MPGPRCEDNEETKSGVAAVWGPGWGAACDEVREVGRVQNCRTASCSEDCGFYSMCS